MSDFAQTLKTWRAVRRYSQLDLALEADISGRHLSFLETGRSRPSREMVTRLGDALQLPLDARNQLLTHAGFAARYAGRNWTDADMAPIRSAVERMLSSHMPYPGIAVDRLWCIREANAAALALFGMLGVGVGDSLIDLTMSGTLEAVVENWPEVAHHTAKRLRVESLAQGGVPELDRAIAYLSKVDGYTERGSNPVIPTIFRQGDLRLSMFSTLAQFGTPEDVTLDDLRIELFFPMDEVTAIALETMAGA
ncbi:helix-turn-helix domain-containing protein [uncultured Tateyamaria sp.]|uniref:helix-turn-helix domain-containing protein n=1 Tax=uncultured Tateyamaria sp. TaxID=455651 RepID=UPI002631D6C2|nr:helix-turn-helix domain-containing protein [uncultured Tateyamaria sp.]